ncbi:MAG: adenosylcobinamide-phosphate synthase CbiB [Desulfobacteraceae bacterium]|jgi:adenosylcobinamide-phosphate synthase|nr:adenosylcobinamide-phosphate synthase CbiB [Desulfobacteraceae bacterium]
MFTGDPWIIIAAAFALDLLLGDPPTWPHPVRWMGQAVNLLEPPLRRWIRRPFVAGVLLVVLLVPGSWVLGFGLTAAAGRLSPVLALAVQVVILWTCLSTRCLHTAAMAVQRALVRQDLGAARQAVAMIVGRQTAHLDAEGVSRAAVETVAENLVDGVVAPLFFALLGGAPLALAYKMVNTLDSMVGYRSPHYLQFGRAAARLDDAANFLPARLSLLLITAAAAMLFRRGRQAWRTARRDGRRHLSPNAGWPEAAFAGALGVRLGGSNRYHGQAVCKPYIGAEHRPVQVIDIARACDLMSASAFCGVLLAVGSALALG